MDRNMPQFTTQRLELRPRSLADFDACLAMDRDAEVTRYIPGPWADSQAHEAFLRERMQTNWGEGLGYWSLFPKDGGNRFLGWVFLTADGSQKSALETGWRLNRSAWGKGYATEATLAVLEHAFRLSGVHQVFADIHPDNLASIRVAAKVGMRLINCLRQDEPFHRYGIMRHQFGTA